MAARVPISRVEGLRTPVGGASPPGPIEATAGLRQVERGLGQLGASFARIANERKNDERRLSALSARNTYGAYLTERQIAFSREPYSQQAFEAFTQDVTARRQQIADDIEDRQTRGAFLELSSKLVGSTLRSVGVENEQKRQVAEFKEENATIAQLIRAATVDPWQRDQSLQGIAAVVASSTLPIDREERMTKAALKLDADQFAHLLEVDPELARARLDQGIYDATIATPQEKARYQTLADKAVRAERVTALDQDMADLIVGGDWAAVPAMTERLQKMLDEGPDTGLTGPEFFSRLSRLQSAHGAAQSELDTAYHAQEIMDGRGAKLDITMRDGDWGDAADYVYRTQIEPALENASLGPVGDSELVFETFASQMVGLVSRFGIIPPRYKGQVAHTLRTGTDEEVMRVARQLALLQSDTRLAGALQDFTEDDKRLAMKVDNLMRRGNQDPVKTARANLFPADPALIDKRREEFKNAFPDNAGYGKKSVFVETAEEIANQALGTGGLWSFFTDPSATPPSKNIFPQELYLDIQTNLLENYLRFGNVEEAKANTALSVAMNWRRTNILSGGKERIVKRPPEVQYGIPNRDPYWLVESTASQLGITPEKANDLLLQLDPKTANDRFPRYRILEFQEGLGFVPRRDVTGEFITIDFPMPQEGWSTEGASPRPGAIQSNAELAMARESVTQTSGSVFERTIRPGIEAFSAQAVRIGSRGEDLGEALFQEAQRKLSQKGEALSRVKEQAEEEDLFGRLDALIRSETPEVPQ